MALPVWVRRAMWAAAACGLFGFVGEPSALATPNEPLTKVKTATEVRHKTRLARGDTVSCTVRVLHLLPEPGGIDKRLDFLKKKLSKPPFSAYKTVKLLSSKELTIAQGAKGKAPMPNGKVLHLTFKEKLLRGENRVRLRLGTKIVDPKKPKYLLATVLTIDNRGTHFQGGDKYQKGNLALAITCQVKQ